MRVAIIPARGGSRRIPGKNKRMFRGMPIICYSIIAAKEAGFDRVLVTTDDREIADIAMLGGAWAIYRKEQHATDMVGTQEVIAQCCTLVPAEHVCCIYPTAPLMLADDIKRGFRMLTEKPGAKFAMSVGAEPLRDAGQFYWGTSKAFEDRAPLVSAHTVMIAIQEKYVCDINIEDDWLRAEKMYDALQRDPNAN